MIGDTARSASQRRRNYNILSSVLVLVSFLLVLSSREGSSLSGMRTAVDDVLAPVLQFAVSPVRKIESLIADFEARSIVLAENEKLKIDIARLRDAENRANTLAMKLARFEAIFNMDLGENVTTAKIPARAVMEIDGPFVRSALLNAGQDKGVTKGGVVMTTDGLLGHIITTGKRSSRALLLGDLNSRIAVMSLRSGERAILTGNNSNVPMLSFVADDANWQNEDELVTSGDAGVLPRGLPVGKVAIDDEGRFNVFLHNRNNSVDWVWIHPFTPILTPEENPTSEQGGGITENNQATNPDIGDAAVGNESVRENIPLEADNGAEDLQ
ncbi:MAG: rod shape-determining protein MreC [Maricaulaceae bacterium]